MADRTPLRTQALADAAAALLRAATEASPSGTAPHGGVTLAAGHLAHVAYGLAVASTGGRFDRTHVESLRDLRDVVDRLHRACRGRGVWVSDALAEARTALLETAPA